MAKKKFHDNLKWMAQREFAPRDRGEQIRWVQEARFLGVWVDEGLGWAGQIERHLTKVSCLFKLVTKRKRIVVDDFLLIPCSDLLFRM